MTAYTAFSDYIAQINDLLCATNALVWDSRTQMPPQGATTRGQQIATISGLVQERFTSDEMARLIEGATEGVAGEDGDSVRVRSVRAAQTAFAIARRALWHFPRGGTCHV